jgi:methionyl-tRNA formyltransferase
VAITEIQGKKFKIHETRVVECSGEPGQILSLTKTGLIIACGEGAVEIRSLQAEGGKRMAAPDYFRGHPLES